MGSIRREVAIANTKQKIAKQRECNTSGKNNQPAKLATFDTFIALPYFILLSVRRNTQPNNPTNGRAHVGHTSVRTPRKQSPTKLSPRCAQIRGRFRNKTVGNSLEMCVTVALRRFSLRPTRRRRERFAHRRREVRELSSSPTADLANQLIAEQAAATSTGKQLIYHLFLRFFLISRFSMPAFQHFTRDVSGVATSFGHPLLQPPQIRVPCKARSKSLG